MYLCITSSTIICFNLRFPENVYNQNVVNCAWKIVDRILEDNFKWQEDQHYFLRESDGYAQPLSKGNTQEYLLKL